MASIKVKFKPSTVADHEGTIFYQILHDRKQRQLFTNYHVLPSEWDENRSMVTTSQTSERKSFILSIRERIRWDVERLNKVIRKLDNKGLTYTADDVIDEFNRLVNEYSLFNYMESHIIKLKQNGKIRTAETYFSTLNSFKKFRKDEDIMLDCLNSEIMEAYEAWHQQRGVAPNTISFYIRILQAAYNRAVEDEIIENRNPFRHVYTGVDKTVKRALPLSAIKKIKALDLSLIPDSIFFLSSGRFGRCNPVFQGIPREAVRKAMRQARRAERGLAFACRIQTLPKKTDAPDTAVIEYSCKTG